MRAAERTNAPGSTPPPDADSAAWLKALERENHELRQANELLRKASAYFALAEFDPPVQAMTAFVDAYRGAYGVEPLCKVLQIAPSPYRVRGGRAATAGFVLDALEQALAVRRPAGQGLIHHSGRGSQYVSIKYAQRLADAAVEPSVGSKGDS